VKKAILGSFLFVIICSAVPALAAEGFTQKDREMLIELKVKMGDIDNRFEQIDKRFEQVDKRFSEFSSIFCFFNREPITVNRDRLPGIFTTDRKQRWEG
jgi:hypothetical protein